MSLIFETLRNLDHAVDPDHTPAQMASAGGRARALPQVRSIGLLLVILAVIIALGLGAVFGMHQIKAWVQSRTTVAKAVKIREARADTQTESSVLPLSQTPPRQEPNHSIRYFPPTADGAQNPSGSAAVMDRPPIIQPPPASEDKSTRVAVVAPDSANNAKAPSLPAGVEGSNMNRDTAVPAGLISNPVSSKAISSPGPKQDAARKPEAQVTILEHTPPLNEKLRHRALERSARIGRLVHDIESALAQGAAGDAHVEGLLKELAQLKGPDHPFVVKLEAFRLLKLGQYEKARNMLEKVAAADAADLEAGMNLVLIDIHDRRFQAARERLLLLRRNHPEDARINDLLRKLP